MLISISGIDCSGKSTQIELLESALHEEGLSVAQLWYRPGYSNELDALRKLVRELMPKALPTVADSRAREAVFKSPGVSGAWIAMSLADTLLQYALKLRVLLASYDAVICDRYLEDAALDFALRFPDAGVENSLWFGGLRLLSPQPDVRLLFHISYEEMLRRMKSKQEPFPDPPAVRRSRFEAYQKLADNRSFHTIDASSSIESVHRKVLSVFDGKLLDTRK
jgi:thymidylate kinase